MENISTCRGKEINSDVKLLGVIPTLISGNDPRQRQILDENLKGKYGPYIIRQPISERPTIRQAMDQNQVVWELPPGKAREGKAELSRLMRQISSRLENAGTSQ